MGLLGQVLKWPFQNPLFKKQYSLAPEVTGRMFLGFTRVYLAYAGEISDKINKCWVSSFSRFASAGSFEKPASAYETCKSVLLKMPNVIQEVYNKVFTCNNTLDLQSLESNTYKACTQSLTLITGDDVETFVVVTKAHIIAAALLAAISDTVLGKLGLKESWPKEIARFAIGSLITSIATPTVLEGVTLYAGYRTMFLVTRLAIEVIFGGGQKAEA